MFKHWYYEWKHIVRLVYILFCFYIKQSKRITNRISYIEYVKQTYNVAKVLKIYIVSVLWKYSIVQLLFKYINS